VPPNHQSLRLNILDRHDPRPYKELLGSKTQVNYWDLRFEVERLQVKYWDLRFEVERFTYSEASCPCTCDAIRDEPE
jgi:hypothetical protein